MKKFILLLITIMALLSFIGTAAPVGICLYGNSPEAPADKIQCFEYVKFERIGEDYRFFTRTDSSVKVTAYRFRGVIPYKPDLSPTHPDFKELLKLYEETAKASPSTRVFLNPKILTMRAQVAGIVAQTESLAKLPTITLADGSKLVGCTMTKIENDTVSVMHQDGISRVKLTDLDAAEKEALNATSESLSLDSPSISSKDSSGTFAKIVFKNGRLAKNAKFKEVLDRNLVFLTSGGSVSIPADQFPGELTVLGEEVVKSLAQVKNKSVSEPSVDRKPTESAIRSTDQSTASLAYKGRDIQRFLELRHPNDIPLRASLLDGVQLILQEDEALSAQDSLGILEKLFGGLIVTSKDAKQASIMVKKLLDSATLAGLSRHVILKAAVESQEKLYTMLEKNPPFNTRKWAAGMVNQIVTDVAGSIKVDQDSLKLSKELGYHLRAWETNTPVGEKFALRLEYHLHLHADSLITYWGITLLQLDGGKNTSIKTKAQALLSDWDAVRGDPVERRHLEFKARELFENELARYDVSRPRRGPKLSSTYIEKTSEAYIPEPPRTAEESAKRASLTSHYKSIGFSGFDAEMLSEEDDNKIDKPSEAMFLLASLYERNDRFDVKKCMSWYDKAAQAGSTKAMFRLHEIFHPNFTDANLGYPDGDAKQSLDWAKKAAENGGMDGMYVMGYYNLNGEYDTEGKSLIVKPNKPNALMWWRKAAEAGSAKAKDQLEKFRD